MRIATSLNIALIRGPEEEMIHRLAQAGFDGLDLHFGDLLDRIDWHDPPAAEALFAPWLEASREHDMAWVQGHGPKASIFSQAPSDRKVRDLCIPSIRAAGRLGVRWMVFHPDVFAGALDKAHRAELLKGNAAFFRSLLPACEETGVGIAIENLSDVHIRHGSRPCPRAFGGTPEELCELVDHIDHPLVGICWDTGHGQLNAHDQEKAIASLGSRLKALHIHENDGHGDDHILPFATVKGVDWSAVARGLRYAGYAGAFTYEARNGFDGVPDALLDDYLSLVAKTARYLAAMIETPG